MLSISSNRGTFFGPTGKEWVDKGVGVYTVRMHQLAMPHLAWWISPTSCVGTGPLFLIILYPNSLHTHSFMVLWFFISLFQVYWHHSLILSLGILVFRVPIFTAASWHVKQFKEKGRKGEGIRLSLPVLVQVQLDKDTGRSESMFLKSSSLIGKKNFAIKPLEYLLPTP